MNKGMFEYWGMEKTRDKDSQRRERGCDSNIMVDYIMGIISES